MSLCCLLCPCVFDLIHGHFAAEMLLTSLPLSFLFCSLFSSCFVQLDSPQCPLPSLPKIQLFKRKISLLPLFSWFCFLSFPYFHFTGCNTTAVAFEEEITPWLVFLASFQLSCLSEPPKCCPALRL